MSNITETYRKPLMSDETGKAISEKLGGNASATEQHINISEQYRKPPMTDETAQEILAKIDGGGGGASALSELSDVNLTSPSDGQVLHYDGTEWINATPVAELPAVTSDDNGDVLTVVEGAWAKAEPSGVEKIYYVDNVNAGANISTEILVQTIKQKYEEGYTIVLKCFFNAYQSFDYDTAIYHKNIKLYPVTSPDNNELIAFSGSDIHISDPSHSYIIWTYLPLDEDDPKYNRYVHAQCNDYYMWGG